tara:strand:+ start:442 stop:1269 length:828 start_codon:yes stop_codon:yes gene_type:complete
MKVIFNSSMPRACSTLLQNIFNQNPEFYATPTDGLIELINGAQKRYSTVPEFKAAVDQGAIKDAWIKFCRHGAHGYIQSLSDKPNVVIKGRGWKGNIDWANMIFGCELNILIMVRDMKSILASFEKLHRSEPEKASVWYNPDEFRGTTVQKRIDMYIKNEPLVLDIDRLEELLCHSKLSEKIMFIRAEDLTSFPDVIMNEIYSKLHVKAFKHDFDNIEQTTHENDIIHGMGDLHTIRKKVTPLVDDSEEILGKSLCDWIDNEYSWYQEYFGYITK